MSSGAGPNILVFPSGVDFFSTKIDRGIIISGESHTVPGNPGPYIYYLSYVPLQANPTTVSIPGYTEVPSSGTVATFQYSVIYSGVQAGLITHNQFQSGLSTLVTYTAYGDVVQSEMINTLGSALVNVETFVLANIASGNFVHVSGDTMTGPLTMNADINLNGGGIQTTVSGTNDIGLDGFPLAQAFIDEIQTNFVHSAVGADLTLSGNTIVVNGDVIPNPSGTLNLGSAVSPWLGLYVENLNSTMMLNSGVHILMTYSGTNDIGNSFSPVANIYANNIVSPSLASSLSSVFVLKTGDTMAGTLAIASGNTLDTYTVTNTNGDLILTAFNSILVNRDVLPVTSGAYNLGSAAMPYDVVYAKSLSGPLLSGNFVLKTGDTMTGNLTLTAGNSLLVDKIVSSNLSSGTINVNSSQLLVDALGNIQFSISSVQMLEVATNGVYISTHLLPTTSGAYNLGAPNTPYGNIYADNLHFGIITSGVIISGASFVGNMILSSGASIIPQISGAATLGSPSSYFGTIYADNIITAGTSGTFVSKFGDTMQGNLLTNASGANNIGSVAVPFNAIYADNIEQGFVHITGDTMTGALIVPEVAFSGTLIASGNAVNLIGQQISVESTNGIISIDANTEVQLYSNGVPKLTITPSGNLAFDSIYPNVSGNYSIGTAIKPFGAVYADEIIMQGVIFTPSGIAGNFVNVSGDTMTGNLVMSAANILTAVSGTNDLGAVGGSWNNLYVNNINGLSFVGTGPFVLKTGDTMTGNLLISGATLAVGQGVLALGTNSTAFGLNTVASGSYSHAEGINNFAYGDFGSHVEGQSNTASGTSSHAEGQSNNALGIHSHAEGQNNNALGTDSHAEGNNTQAFGDFSHAEGANTIASGSYSHVEGLETKALGEISHAEGYFTIAYGISSHVEGSGALAIGNISHAEGYLTIASGTASHVEGFKTSASGLASHAEGNYTYAIGNASHAEGFGTSFTGNVAWGDGSHAEGLQSFASGTASHAEGTGTLSIGYASHAEGQNSQTLGFASHAEGSSVASGDYSHAEGTGIARGIRSHAEGQGTIASGINSHAEGFNTIAYGTSSHAEGELTIASGNYSHAEGDTTKTFGDFSHAEGNSTIASGQSSHAEGQNSIAFGLGSHAEGENTITYGLYSHAEGNSAIASGIASHAQGESTLAAGEASHSEGLNTKAYGNYSHVQGNLSIASGNTSFAHGLAALALHDYSIVFADINGASSTTNNQFTLGFSSGVSLISGTSILNTVSGANSLGSITFPFKDVYAKTGYFTNISGMSPINILSPFVLPSTPPASGTAIGTTGQIIMGTDGYLYGCSGTNLWGRINLSSF